jgi:LacI family transcriptional regulator
MVSAATKRKKRAQHPVDRVRVIDVAKAAGCSTATVSRAINDPNTVAPAMRAKIQSAMRDLGYLRNYAARALRSQRSHMVGVVIPTLSYAIYAQLVEAAQRQLSKAGFSTLIATFEYDLLEEYIEARSLMERGAEALVLVGCMHRPELYELLARFNVPFVNTYVLDQESSCPTVGFDNAAAAAEIVRHLVHIGHRRIAFISGITENNDRTTQRLAGVRREMHHHNLDLPNRFVVESPYSIAGGHSACTDLLWHSGSPPSAIICGNDVLAIGALSACEARGLRIPEDISIAGFDNLEIASHLKPPLTTIDVPAETMGRQAAQYLLGRLEGNDAWLHYPVDVRLVARETTAPPKLRSSMTMNK